MSLADFNCEVFDISIRFRLEDFDKPAFLTDVEADEDHSPYYRWSFGSTKKPGTEHSHMTVEFPDDDEDSDEPAGKLRIIYHSSESKVDDVRPPHMEDCAIWIGQFFKVDDLWADTNAVFLYDEKYEPILALPFPLVTENKTLSGSMVSGVTIEPPIQTKLKRVLIQRFKDDNNTLLFASGRDRVRLKSFDLDKQIERVISPVRSLIRETKEQAK